HGTSASLPAAAPSGVPWPWLLFLLPWFFFSSRRRHTRSKRDWSSDVCSSDLPASDSWCTGRMPALRIRSLTSRLCSGVCTVMTRSEERRVGKEGRARWALYPAKEESTEQHARRTRQGASTHVRRASKGLHDIR